MASNTQLNILVALEDMASDGIQKMNSYLGTLTGASVAFTAGIAGAATAIGGFGYTALKSAADAEQTRIAFTTMLGSAEKAGEFIRDLVDFAQKTPFELKGLESASKQLLAYGFAQNEVLPNLTALGNIASGVGMDKLPNLILAFGQVRAAGKLMGSELRQFTEAGVPLLEEISKVTGIAIKDLAGNVGHMNISFGQVQQALFNLSTGSGRFANLMQNQSKSLSGMVSNLHDAWEKFLRGQGSLLIDWAKQFVGIATDIVNNVLPAWVEKTRQVAEWLGQNKIVIYAVAGAIINAMVPAIWATVAATSAAVWAMATTLAPLFVNGALIAGVIYGIISIAKHWDEIKAKISQNNVIMAAVHVLHEGFNQLASLFRAYLLPVFVDLVSKVRDELWPALTDLYNTIKPYLPQLETLGKALAVIVVVGLVPLAAAIIASVTVFSTAMVVTAKFAAVLVDQLVGAIKLTENAFRALEQVPEFLRGIWESVLAGISSVWGTISGTIAASWQGISNIMKYGVALVVGLVVQGFEYMGIDITGVLERLVSYLTGFWQQIKVEAGLAIAEMQLFLNESLATISLIWNTAWTGMLTYITATWGGIKGIALEGWSWLVGKFKEFTVPLSKAWDGMWEGFKSAVVVAWEGIKSTITSNVNWIITQVNKLIEAINTVARKGGGALGFSAPQIPSIPLLANGGIVNRPTLAMIGEAGPEAVIPLSKLGSTVGSGGITINITGNTISNALDIEDIAYKVQRAITDTLNANGRYTV